MNNVSTEVTEKPAINFFGEVSNSLGIVMYMAAGMLIGKFYLVSQTD